MDGRLKMRSAALVGALAAVAVTAFATNGTLSNSRYVPHYGVAQRTPVPAPAAQPIAVADSLAPGEEIVVETAAAPREAPASPRGDVVVPVAERRVAPAIIVEDRRLTRDERIRADVMERLASNPRLSGLIGVESRDAVVRLTGFTRTVGQARHAERDARGVMGVRAVSNEIRPRVGGSV